MGFSQFATLAIAALGAMQPVLSFMFRFSGSPYGSFSYMEHSFFVNAATIAYAVAMSVSLYAAVLIKQK